MLRLEKWLLVVAKTQVSCLKVQRMRRMQSTPTVVCDGQAVTDVPQLNTPLQANILAP